MEELIDSMVDEWWTSSSRDTFIEWGNKLRDAGWKDDDILEMFTQLYSAVCQEYGQ